MKDYKIAVIATVVILLLLAAGYKLYQQRQNEKIFTGTVEVTKADITPKVSGYIAQINAAEGDSVDKGTQLVKIDDEDYLLQLEHDKAALAKAEAILLDLRKGARLPELEDARAKAESAASTCSKAELDWQRYKALYTDGAVSRQQYDAAENNAVVAKKQLQSAESVLELLESGTREDQITAQEQEVKRCRALVLQSQKNITYTELKSPVNGVVLTKNYETGEFAAANTALMTVADLSDCWVKIYMPSEMLGKIAYGQQVTVKLDAYPQRDFKGHIEEISDNAEYTPRQSITARERANLVFGVKIKVDNEEKLFKPGMVADVIFDG